MRMPILLALLLFGVSSAAGAQARDTTTRRDSLARRDSAAARADSLLQRELQRIRGEPRTSAPGDTLGLPRQDTVPELGIHARLEAGVVLGHEVFRNASVETDAGVGFIVRGGVEYRFRHGLGTFGMLGGSLARVTATGTLSAEQTGTTTQIDLLAGISWRPPIRQEEHEPVVLHVAGGGAWLSGPDGVPPYSAIDDDDLPFGVWEVGVTVKPATWPIGVMGVFQSVRVLPDDDDDGSRANRIILALRVGR